MDQLDGSSGSTARVRGCGPAPLRVLPLVGLAFAGAASVSAAPRPAPRPTPVVLPPPWGGSEDGSPAGSLDPTARPAEPEPRLEPPPWRDGTSADDRGPGERVRRPRDRARLHPAIHGERRRAEQRLFPRAARRYTVRAGDTLWDIAAATLGSDDPRRIARYWPRIHRANRDVIGPDPDRIFPGQRLVLPGE